MSQSDALENSQPHIVVGVSPRRDFGIAPQTAEAEFGLLVEGADADARRGDHPVHIANHRAVFWHSIVSHRERGSCRASLF